LLLFIPFVMLLTMLPVSFAGWGLRRVMVAAFGMAGVASKPLAVSIAFGSSSCLSTCPASR
jgi:hypothetical protein